MHTPQEKNFATLCHLISLIGFGIPFGHIIGPLIIWLLKRHDSKFIDDQGKEVVNFQISMTIYLGIIIFFGFILTFLTFGLFSFILIPTLCLFAIIEFIWIIIAAIQSNEGKTYRYPINLRLIK